MAIPDHIPRNRPDPDSLDFDALKKQGVALNQELSGKNWTDYNQHDPGVTILEQLCYGLTDLAYRSGFPVEDYLGDKNGRIDYDRAALFRPQDILPCRPVTANDYRRLLYDAIPEIEDVWLKAKRSKGLHANGLFTVYIKVDGAFLEGPDAAQRKAALQCRVRQVYSAHRNLCEDIDDVHIVETENIYLSGEIEIRGRTPAKVFADVFFLCSRRMSSALKIERYEDVFAEGRNREDVFCGPLTTHGFIDEVGMQGDQDSISTVKLIALIRQVEGVVQVRNLALRNVEGKVVDDLPCDPAQKAFPILAFPQTPRQKAYLQFALSKNSRDKHGDIGAATDDAELEKAAAILEAARLELKKLNFEFRAFRSGNDMVDRFIKLPQGTPHDFAQYYSIQNQFPAIYGINQYGIPPSAPAARRAKGKQLKGYLYPYEQLMANYLQTLEGIVRLFSVDETLQQTYFAQFLGNRNIPDVEGLYHRDVTQTAEAVDDIAARRDNVADRRNRVLDVMLAMYGEEFPDDAFLLHGEYRGSDAVQWLIESKIEYLKNLPDIGCNRNGAADYLQDIDTAGNVSGLQKKVGLLMGLSNVASYRSFTDDILKHKILLTPDPEVDHAAERGRREPQGNPVCVMPPEDKEAREALSLRNGRISVSMFRRGVNLSNYVLMRKGEQVAVGFRVRESAPVSQLSERADTRQATLFAHQFRNALVQLNLQCEGLHLVEHLLLRPLGPDAIGQENANVPPDFYACRVSVIFPGWTARFSNREFRKSAEEAVCRNLAAHIFPDFFWLDFADMHIFEKYQHAWRTALRQLGQVKRDTIDFDAINSASDKLIAFLQKKRAQGARNYWV
ncbi:MAG TPA: hypothetical protein VIF60_01565 [Burkholderiaceae bacterium]